MVDVAVTNTKLEDRALRILRDLAGVDRLRGAELLAAAGGSVKQALLMAVGELDAASAAAALEAAGGQLRPALRRVGAELRPH
jgi:N-acetylmuramic acid 6-phosphate etherase